jgi:hypothetical protein
MRLALCFLAAWPVKPIRVLRLRNIEVLLGFKWLAWVLRQHPRGLAGESGVATGQDRGAELFRERAQREGDHLKPEPLFLCQFSYIGF